MARMVPVVLAHLSMAVTVAPALRAAAAVQQLPSAQVFRMDARLAPVAVLSIAVFGRPMAPVEPGLQASSSCNIEDIS